MIVTVTINPAIDKTIIIDDFKINSLNRYSNAIIDAGGKGINVSKTLKAFEVESKAMGFIAGNTGDFIKKSLNDMKIENDFVEVFGQTRTNLKIINKDSDLTEINELGPEVNEDQIEELTEKIIKNCQKDSVVVLSGSITSKMKNDFYYHLCLRLKQQGLKVIVDADKDLLANAIEAKPTLIKPNTYELCKYFKVEETNDLNEIKKMALVLVNKGIEYVVISMGKDGAMFVNKDNIIFTEGLKIPAKSTVGAGDAMVAALALSLDQGYDFEKMAKLAVAMSAGACLTEGTKPSDKNQVMKLIEKVKIKRMEKNEN